MVHVTEYSEIYLAYERAIPTLFVLVVLSIIYPKWFDIDIVRQFMPATFVSVKQFYYWFFFFLIGLSRIFIDNLTSNANNAKT